MKQFIIEGPNQLVEARQCLAGISLPEGDFSRVVLLGMGGSALSAGFVEMLRKGHYQPWEWHVVREYDIPCPLDHKTLVFTLSYSGNTEEALATFATAARSEATILAVSSGGKLAEEARTHGVTHIQIPPKPEGFQPRFALYFMLGVVYETLVRLGLLDSIESLDSLATHLKSLNLAQQGQELASWLGQRFPVVYTPPDYETSVARIWRIKFNENTKMPALWGALPEANHNEMIAFVPEFAQQFAVLLLTSDCAHPRVTRRFELMEQMLTDSGYAVRTVPMEGSNMLRKALSSLMLADWVTYYMATAMQTDPVAIPAIQEFKKRL